MSKQVQIKCECADPKCMQEIFLSQNLLDEKELELSITDFRGNHTTIFVNEETLLNALKELRENDKAG